MLSALSWISLCSDDTPITDGHSPSTLTLARGGKSPLPKRVSAEDGGGDDSLSAMEYAKSPIHSESLWSPCERFSKKKVERLSD